MLLAIRYGTSSTTTLRSASLVSESIQIGLLVLGAALLEVRGLDAGELVVGEERSGETDGEVGDCGEGPISSSSMHGDPVLIG
jgi:hypothetical protein